MPRDPQGEATFDRLRYPRLAAYLERLPAGLESYPDCRVRGAVLRHQFERKPLSGAPPGSLPARLEHLARELPTNSGWVPEVELMAANLAIADHYRLSDGQWLEYAYQSNKALLSGLIFRVALALLSPHTVLDTAPRRWSSIHKGTTLSGRADGRGAHEVFLDFPPYLFERLEVGAFGQAFRAALELSRARDPSIEVVSVEPRRAVYRARWA